MPTVNEQNNHTTQLETLPVGRLLLHYSIPAVVGMVMTSLYNIVDRVFIGQGVGPMAISGLALTFPLMTLVTAVGTLIGVGASARMSIVLGMGDLRWARNILGNALIMTFVLSAVLVALSMSFLQPVLALFGGTEQTIPYAADYLRIVIPGSIFVNLSYSFSGVIRATGYPHKAMYVILIGVLLNVVLDPIFIFVLDMGIRGAAVATVISMAVSSVVVMAHFVPRSRPVHFCGSCFRLRGYILRNITSIGMAPFLINVAASAVNIILNNRLLSEGGDLAIGALGVVNSYGILIVMVVMGVCQGMQPIVGYNFGAKRHKRVKDTLLLTMRVATVVVIVGFMACELMPETLARAFTADRELIRLSAHGMRMAYMLLPLVGMQIVISNFFMSIGKASNAIFLSLSRQVLFLIPCVYLLSSWFGLTGVWLSLPASDLLATAVSLWMLRRERRIFYSR